MTSIPGNLRVGVVFHRVILRAPLGLSPIGSTGNHPRFRCRPSTDPAYLRPAYLPVPGLHHPPATTTLYLARPTGRGPAERKAVQGSYRPGRPGTDGPLSGSPRRNRRGTWSQPGRPEPARLHGYPVDGHRRRESAWFEHERNSSTVQFATPPHTPTLKHPTNSSGSPNSPPLTLKIGLTSMSQPLWARVLD